MLVIRQKYNELWLNDILVCICNQSGEIYGDAICCEYSYMFSSVNHFGGR